MKRLKTAVGAASLFVSLAAAADTAPVIYTKQGSFDEVREAVTDALTNRGLVLSYHARLGEMLERTGKDLGATRQIFRRAENFEFCSASHSRAMMEADPTAIAYCPYILFVYELPEAPGKIHVGYRPPPAIGKIAEPAKKVRQLLDDLAKEAVK